MSKQINFFKNKRRWLYVVLGILVFTATAAAVVKKKRNAFFKWLPKEEMKAYFEENILPVLTEYRSTLENELSTTEKQQIIEMRANLKSLKDEKKTLGKSLREKRQNGEEPTTEERQEMRATMRKMRQITHQAWDIVDAHSDFFDAMFENTENQRKQWREDMFAMVKNHRETLGEKEGHRQNRKERSRGENGKFGHGERGRHGKGLRGGPHRDPRAKFMELVGGPQAELMFVLWNPDEPLLDEDERISFGDNTTTFPNPAFDGSSLSYQVDVAGKVNITLVNARGEVVKNLLDDVMTSGTHTLNNDVSSLQEGVYFYKITSPSGTVTKRFVKR